MLKAVDCLSFQRERISFLFLCITFLAFLLSLSSPLPSIFLPDFMSHSSRERSRNILLNDQCDSQLKQRCAGEGIKANVADMDF